MPEQSLLEKIKAADKPRLVEHHVKEWGVTVYVKTLTVGQRDAYETEVFNSRNKGGLMDNPRSKFLVRVLCDKDGAPLCKPEQFKELAGLSSKPCEELFELAQKVNKLTNDDVEELAKN